jgi:uncharacterized membrane protein
MKTITKTLATGVTLEQKRQRSGAIRVSIVENNGKQKSSLKEKLLVSPIALTALIAIAYACVKVFGSLSLKTLLILSPVIFFILAVFTAVLIQFYLLIFKS